MVTGATSWEAPQIRLIDFGMAHEFTAMSRPGGTPGYMPPEVWDQGLWTPKGDVFSFGVMLFSMWMGYQPFWHRCRSLEEVRRRSREDVLQMGGENSSPALDALVYSMTEKNFHDRPSTLRLLQDANRDRDQRRVGVDQAHLFPQDHGPGAWFAASDLDSVRTIDHSVLEALEQRRTQTDLQTDLRKALLADLVSRTNLAQMPELNKIFLELDCNNDGVVSADDLRRTLGELGEQWPEERVESLIHALMNGDEDEVPYEEFMGQLLAATEPAENELLATEFKELDGDRKGYLNLQDVRALLQRSAVVRILGQREPEELLREMDPTGSGRVTFHDFHSAAHGRRQVLRRRLAALLGPRQHIWKIGDEVEYLSRPGPSTEDTWIPSTIANLDFNTGAVQVECLAGYWLRGVELQTRLRAPPTLLRYAASAVSRLLGVFIPTTMALGVSRVCAGSRAICGNLLLGS